MSARELGDPTSSSVVTSSRTPSGVPSAERAKSAWTIPPSCPRPRGRGPPAVGAERPACQRATGPDGVDVQRRRARAAPSPRRGERRRPLDPPAAAPGEARQHASTVSSAAPSSSGSPLATHGGPASPGSRPSRLTAAQTLEQRASRRRRGVGVTPANPIRRGRRRPPGAKAPTGRRPCAKRVVMTSRSAPRHASACRRSRLRTRGCRRGCARATRVRTGRVVPAHAARPASRGHRRPHVRTTGAPPGAGTLPAGPASALRAPSRTRGWRGSRPPGVDPWHPRVGTVVERARKS